MANLVNQIDFENETLTELLAKATTDASGTYDDVLTTLKIDNPGDEATAAQIKLAFGQLLGNIYDDYIKATYPSFYKATKMWLAVDATARDALGSDDGLVANDIAWVVSTKSFWYVSSVDGPGSSTWIEVLGSGSSTAAPGPRWTFDSGTADADPGAGKFRYNNATQSSATFIYVNDDTVDGQSMGRSWVLRKKSNDGLLVQQEGTPGNIRRWTITGAVTLGAGYLKIPIAVPAGSQGSDLVVGETISFTFTVDPSVTGGYDLTVSTGDKIAGQTELNIEAGTSEDVNVVAGTGGATSDGGEATLSGGDGGATSGEGGGVTISSGDAQNNNDIGGLILIAGGAGNGTGNGADLIFGAGAGGTSGDGGVSVLRGGVGGGTVGTGGTAFLEGGDATGTNSDGGSAIVGGGNPTGSGTRGKVELRNEGPDTHPAVQLETLGTNGATPQIFTGSRDPNANVTGDPGDYYMRVEGVSSTLYIHVGASPSTVWTEVGGGGVPALSAIELGRSTDYTMTGTPAGLAFNREDGPSHDTGVYTVSLPVDDIEVDVTGNYTCHFEMTVVSTSVSESEYIVEWYKNGSVISPAAFHRLHTDGSGFDDTPNPVSTTIIRALVATDTMGVRISRTSGAGGTVPANSPRLSLTRIG